MIGNATTIMQQQRIEAGMPSAVVSRVITTANAILQQCVGATNYATLDALTDTAPEIAGGVVDGNFYEGLSLLISEMVFALLANERIVITGFGTVEKTDEYSHSVDYFDTCKAKEAHFLQGVQQLCKLKGWRYTYPETTYYTERLL